MQWWTRTAERERLWARKGQTEAGVQLCFPLGRIHWGQTSLNTVIPLLCMTLSVYSYVGSAWFEIFNKCWWLEVKLQVFLFFVAKSTRTFLEKGKRGLSLSNPVVSVANVNSVLGRKHGVCNAHCRVAVSSRYFIYRKQWTRYEWWS